MMMPLEAMQRRYHEEDKKLFDLALPYMQHGYRASELMVRRKPATEDYEIIDVVVRVHQPVWVLWLRLLWRRLVKSYKLGGVTI